MKSGYCFQLNSGSPNWKDAKDERWEIEVYSPTGTEKRKGHRRIDGYSCVVFRCPDGKYRAQTMTAVYG